MARARRVPAGDGARDLAGTVRRPDPQPLLLPRPPLPRGRRGGRRRICLSHAILRPCWGGSWVDGVFGFHHYHSTSHEVLGVIQGQATLELGGPQGRAVEVSTGDVVVLPAGTGHRLASSDQGFTVVGAYPEGQEGHDLLRGEDPAEVAAARERIAALGAPPEDPVGGEGVASWR